MDIRSVNRILNKVWEINSKVVFSKIGEKMSLCVVGMSDAFYYQDDNAVSREMILLVIKETVATLPLYWKCGVIWKVCTSTKAAETRGVWKVVDDAVNSAQ